MARLEGLAEGGGICISRKLLDKSPKHLRRIIECALNTGMRRGEILNLKWNQIRNGFVYLTKTKTNEYR